MLCSDSPKEFLFLFSSLLSWVGSFFLLGFFSEERRRGFNG
uniref:Saur1 n=1 Tax=Arundo donax TaxID=35708 RepID=A0A0A8XTS6_ARUDO